MKFYRLKEARIFVKSSWTKNDSAAKQQISWVVSLWWSSLTFVWPEGFPNIARLQRHLADQTVFCIDEIVPDYVVYLVKI